MNRLKINFNHLLQKLAEIIKKKGFSKLSEKCGTTTQVVCSCEAVSGDGRGRIGGPAWAVAGGPNAPDNRGGAEDAKRPERGNYLLRLLRMELDLLKSAGAGEGGGLRQFRQERQYEAVRWAAEELPWQKRAARCISPGPATTSGAPGKRAPVP